MLQLNMIEENWKEREYLLCDLMSTEKSNGWIVNISLLINDLIVLQYRTQLPPKRWEYFVPL